jgi:myo-inositol-1(or 4)-monophosphatase
VQTCLRDSTPAASVARLLREAAFEVGEAVAHCPDWCAPGVRPGQTALDLAADAAALHRLLPAGVSVLSEESGHHDGDSALTVVVDPVDGTENAVRGFPHYATSLCAVDEEGPIAAVVLDLTSGACYEAVRGERATRDGVVVQRSDAEQLDAAFVGYSGLPSDLPRWRVGRAIGSVALGLCYVAEGIFDAFIDFDDDVHAPWDYLGGYLVCRQAGALVVDARGRELTAVDGRERRQPLGAATLGLLAQAREEGAAHLANAARF